MKPIIELHHVTYKYLNSSEEILKDISLDIHQGEHITILGPNGSGKSTLVKLINGLLRPVEGTVFIDGTNTKDSQEKIWDVRSKIGIVFQNPDNQIVANTVEEEVAFGLENQSIDPTVIRERVDMALSIVGLLSNRYSNPNALSGGQKQKLALAGIIALKPKVIILDEATSMLDPSSKKEITQVLMNLKKTNKITLINITHAVQDILLSDRTMIMNNGSILLDGATKDVVKERDLLRNIGLEVPLPVEIAFRLRKKGYHLSNDIVHEEELIKELWKFV